MIELHISFSNKMHQGDMKYSKTIHKEIEPKFQYPV